MKKLSILFVMSIGLQAADKTIGPENADQTIGIALIANDQLAGAATSETDSQPMQLIQQIPSAQIQVIQVVQPTTQSICKDILRLCTDFRRFVKNNLWCPCRFSM